MDNEQDHSLETRLRAELEQAEKAYLEAPPEQKHVARQAYRQALTHFTELVLHNKLSVQKKAAF